jgi:hypothetical protein
MGRPVIRPPDPTEQFVRDSVDLGVAVDPTSVKHILTQLDWARLRSEELRLKLMEVRGEKCEHWVDGSGGDRVAIPVYGCRHCS